MKKGCVMVVERQNNEILIRLPDSFDIQEVQRLLDYFRFMESSSKNQGTEEQAASLARQVENNWWKENKSRFLP